MVKWLLVICVLFATGCSRDHTEYKTNEVALIPKPVQLKQNNGVFKLSKATSIVIQYQHKSLADLLKDYILSVADIEVQIKKASNSKSTIDLQIDDSLEDEAYAVTSTEEEVQIIGGSTIGLLHGIQTFRQILLQQSNPKYFPILSIKDEPKFPWRGMLLDCSRHFMEKDFVKRYIDLLALYKMNVLHWHITEDQGWRIEIKQFPKLTEVGAWRNDPVKGRYGGYYTQADIKEIIAYASERGITVVPEIELPGHAQSALAAYPQYSCTGGPFEVETEWGVFKEIYCAGNDSTFWFLENILDEVFHLFPSKYIHIGGDEVPKFRWEHCSKCQNRIKAEGLHDEHELQSYFIQRIQSYLLANGRILIGWDEILEGGLAENAIVQSWRGFDGAKQAVQHGNQAIVSPTSHAYFDYGLNDIDLEKVYSFNPIPGGLSEEEQRLILGGECNMWSERAPQEKVDSKVFPRILAMSEVLWSQPTNRLFSEFKSRVANHYPILDKLGVQYGFETVPVKIKTKPSQEGIEVSLASYDDSFNLYYQVNDDIRNTYSNPFVIQEPSNLNITFGRGQKVFDDTITQRLTFHKAVGYPTLYSAPYHSNYTAGGDNGLTNGKKGSAKFKDGNWQGYWGNNIEVEILLDSLTEVSTFSAGFLQYNNAWIFLPAEVEFYYSSNMIDFTMAGTVSTEISPKDKTQLTHDFVLEVDPVMVKQIKMVAKSIGPCPDWHDAAGSDSWLFIDEIEMQ